MTTTAVLDRVLFTVKCAWDKPVLLGSFRHCSSGQVAIHGREISMGANLQAGQRDLEGSVVQVTSADGHEFSLAYDGLPQEVKRELQEKLTAAFEELASLTTLKF